MEAAAPIVILVVVLAIVALLAMTRRKAWNADGSDDHARHVAQRNSKEFEPDDR
jgi:hypothetical protein